MYKRSCFKMQSNYHSEGRVTLYDSTQHDTNDHFKWLG